MSSSAAKTALFLLLAVIGGAFAVYWGRDLRARWRARPDEAGVAAGMPSLAHLAIGFVTDFFDTLGIGSYATTTSLYRLRGTVPDALIPGTLNVGHTVPTFIEALIFIAIVDVEMPTLAGMIAAAVAGAWAGAGIVVRWERRAIQRGMGIALVFAAVVMLLGILEVVPSGGQALGLPWSRLAVAVIANFVFGALMNLGIGLFAPCMIAVTLLGMSPKGAFPIMMGSCAFLMPVASARFIAHRRYEPRAALGLTLGGVPAVLVAAFIVRSLPLEALRVVVVVVVAYTAAGLLRASAREAL